MSVFLHLLASGLPGQIEDVCPLIPNIEKSLEEIQQLAESGVRYTQMPHVIEVRQHKKQKLRLIGEWSLYFSFFSVFSVGVGGAAHAVQLHVSLVGTWARKQPRLC